MAPLTLPNSYSDGSQQYWPGSPYEKAPSDIFYQEKLAKMWTEEMKVEGQLIDLFDSVSRE
jgi:hypothetical protein